MKKRIGIIVLVGVVLGGAVGLGAADRSWADDGFYVIAVNSGTFKGAWSSTTVYSAKDIVFYNGSSWFSLRGQNQNKEPDASAHLLDPAGPKGEHGGNRRHWSGGLQVLRRHRS